jgi:signal transduction histidine kinase/CheY-like chemotaxis protein/HPt (histidine-containing phosphotransfer) domain-containing protein
MGMRQLWIEQPLGELEDRYRQYYLESDIKISTIAIFVWVVANAAFVYSDYALFGTSRQFWLLALSRTAINVWGIALVLIFEKVKQASTYDWLLFSFLLCGAFMFLYSNSTRPPSFAGPAMTNALAILSAYLVFQTRVTFRIIPNVVLSVGILFILWRGSSEPAPWTNVLILSLIISNALGIPVAVRLSNLRRAEFMSQHELRREVAHRRKAEETLKQAKEAAESATRAKGEFLANVSHEIRTPLNAILGMIDLIADSGLNEQQAERVRVAKQAADILLALLNDVLDLSKIEAGRLDLEETGFDARSVLSTTAALLAAKADDKNLLLNFSVSDAVPRFLRGDANRLKQILLNLGHNAIKFTDKGEISFRVDLQDQSDGAAVLHFAVSDTGVGIPPDKLNSIFDRFSQADSSTTRRYGGSGLGLAIASQLSRAMGGDMWVESQLGKGSTFHFTVSFGTDDSVEGTDESTTQDLAAMPDLSGMKVLLAEDNIFNQAVAVEVLKKLGCDVQVAATGKEAVEAFGTHRFDIVLMDLQMPEIDGYEATRIIRSKETGTRIPIIAQTAHAFTEDKKRCMETGMDDFISKPITASELLKVLARFAPSRKSEPRVSENRSSQAARTHAETFDPSGLLARLEGDVEAFQELSRVFFQSVSQQVETLRNALGEQDLEQIARTSHAIKGACANFGANLMEGIALQTESSAKAGDLRKVADLVGKLDKELAKVRQAAES